MKQVVRYDIAYPLAINTAACFKVNAYIMNVIVLGAIVSLGEDFSIASVNYDTHTPDSIYLYAKVAWW